MGKLGLTLLLILLCCNSNSNSQGFCPYKCQCFTPDQVLCSDERMTSLPTNMSTQVKEVIVITSAVTYLFAHTLQENPQITKLVFLNNMLRSIHSNAFEYLTELQELEISGNPWLQQLFLGTFSKQENLTKLLLNFNRFSTVLPGLFDSLKQLETLQMKSNIISYLPAFLFMNLNSLRTLELSHNKLEEMTNETFSGLERLEILKMNYNLISNLTINTFHNLSQIVELHLEGNKIAQLSDNIFSALTKLRVLNLRGNHLTSFTDKVFGFESSHLEELNLQGNRLTELSSLSSFSSLTDLILSFNQLSSLQENLFTNVTALENLDLSENLLTSLPERIFKDLLSMNTMNLHRNNLSTVDPKLFEDQVLIQRLYLSDNQLENLPAGLLDPFIMQHTVRLHGNPWKCDCHMWYLHDWVLRNSRNIEMLDRVLCETPYFLRKQTITSINKDQLVCQLFKDDAAHLSTCSLQASNDTMTIKCKTAKCSAMTVKVQCQQDDGSFREHILKNESDDFQCSNETVTEGNIY
ncbi:uncharacterized protein FYW49_008120 [Xenentodon cancila]